MANSRYLISQLFAFLAFVVSLYAYQRGSKKKILLTMIVSNSLNLIHYAFLNAYSGCITKVVGFFRDFAIVKKGKKKANWLLVIFILIYLLVTIITYKGLYSVLPLLAASIYICGIWNGNELTIKKTAVLCYFFWLAYNICIFSIVAIIANIISIVSAFIAVKRYKKEG